MTRHAALVAALTWATGALSPASAQTTYYLHSETDWSAPPFLQMLKLTAAGPAGMQQTADLKNQPAGDYAINAWGTIAGVPNLVGTIPSGSTISFTLHMRKTSNYGTVYPQATIGLNWSNQVPLCEATGVSGQTPTQALTTTLAAITVSCQTTAAVTMTASDRVYLIAGFRMTAGPGNKTMKVELQYAGSNPSRAVVPSPIPPTPTINNLNPASGPVNWPVTITGSNFGATPGTVRFFDNRTAQIDSWSNTSIAVRVPANAASGPVTVTTANNVTSSGAAFSVIGPPTLTSLTPATAHVSDVITIAGSNFLDTQATSTVTFKGVPATPVTWTNTSIQVPVPSGATSGDVVVKVSDQPSNGLPFTVIPAPALAAVFPSGAQVGAAVSIIGARFGATQGTSSITFFNGIPATATSWSDTHITTSVPAGATTGSLVVKVSDQPSNDLPFNVLIAGSIGGTITRVTGGTGIAGATVHAVLTGGVKGSASTASDGTYAIPGLDPGTYDVRVFAAGFSSELRQGIVVTSTNTTTVNVPMYVPGGVSGRVTQSDGITPIVGAAIAVYDGSAQKGATNTNGLGDYTIGALRPGGYTVQAASVGYRTSELGTTVSENATTTRNFSLDGAPSGSVLYAYDALGRLVQVTDPSGDAAIYRYDAVGNITAIERTGGSSVSVSAFTPNSGPVGTAVTLYGTGFSSTPAQNTVTFNGAALTVTSSTATTIAATIPSGAVVGTPYPFAVTTPVGSATSGTAFTVTGVGAPTITSVAPASAMSGTALTVEGTNFESVAANNNLRVNLSPAQLSSATATILLAPVPPSATTGRVSVSTPNGTAVTPDYLWIAPPPYALSALDSTGVLPFLTPTQVSVPPTKIALRVFDAVEGQRVVVHVTGTTGGSAHVYLYEPFGTVAGDVLAITDGFLDTVDLRATATYSVVYDPSTTSEVAGGTLTLYNVPADVIGQILPGGPAVPVATSVGQNGRLTFTATAGQRIALGQAGYNCFTSTTTILKPGGGQQVSTCGGTFIDVQALSAPGTYTILVDPKGATSGTTTLTLYSVPADLILPIVAGGDPVPVMTSVGQNARLTFTATTGQRIAVGQAGYNCFTSTTKILKPDGSELVSTCGGEFIEVQLQPQDPSGTYTILVDPKDAAAGTTTLTLYSVPPDATGGVTINGSGFTLNMNAIAQNGVVTFSGTQGQQARVHISGNNVSGFLDVSLVQILPGGGETVLASGVTLSATFDLATQTLPATGDYKVVVSPRGTATGSATVSVLNP